LGARLGRLADRRIRWIMQGRVVVITLTLATRLERGVEWSCDCDGDTFEKRYRQPSYGATVDVCAYAGIRKKTEECRNDKVH
jgi:hypothetical protein